MQTVLSAERARKVSVATWQAHGDTNGWKMPEAPLWKRLPVVRHARGIWNAFMVARHQARWAGIGIPNGYDEWVLWGIFHGYERPRGKR